jgi:hypothetical protein
MIKKSLIYLIALFIVSTIAFVELNYMFIMKDQIHTLQKELVRHDVTTATSIIKG